MLFHHASELAIRATLFLSLQPPGKLTPVHEIASETGVSEAYLAKVLQRLTTAGLMRAFRGPGRGMELAHASEEITLGAVVQAMEGPPGPEWCVLGRKFCSDENPCPLHDRWVPLRREIQRLLDETTVASLVQRWSEGATANTQLIQASRHQRTSPASPHANTKKSSTSTFPQSDSSTKRTKTK